MNSVLGLIHLKYEKKGVKPQFRLVIKDSMNVDNLLPIQFSKKLYNAALVLRKGDYVKINYNIRTGLTRDGEPVANLIATKIERV